MPRRRITDPAHTRPAIHPAKAANLRPWKRGQSGNPKGRPALPTLREALAEVMSEPTADMPSSLLAILRALRDRAVSGDVRAAEVLLDRAYGKPVQQTDITTRGDALHPITPPILWSDDVRVVSVGPVT